MDSRKDWRDPELMSSRVDWCNRVAEKRKALAKAIIKGNDHRAEMALGRQLWDMMKTGYKHHVSLQLSLLRCEISNVAFEAGRKRTLFYVKL